MALSEMTRTEAYIKALDQQSLLKNFNCSIVNGKLIVEKKEGEDSKDGIIEDRFDILDL